MPGCSIHTPSGATARCEPGARAGGARSRATALMVIVHLSAAPPPSACDGGTLHLHSIYRGLAITFPLHVARRAPKYRWYITLCYKPRHSARARERMCSVSPSIAPQGGALTTCTFGTLWGLLNPLKRFAATRAQRINASPLIPWQGKPWRWPRLR